MADYIMNKVLCVLVNIFGKTPRGNIIPVFSEFFSEDEIIEAKRVLLELADKLNPRADELKKIKPRVGDGKIRHGTADILQVYAVLDARNAHMPRFLAADTMCIPTFKDIKLTAVNASITDILTKDNEINSTSNKLVNVRTRLSLPTGLLPTATQPRRNIDAVADTKRDTNDIDIVDNIATTAVHAPRSIGHGRL